MVRRCPGTSFDKINANSAEMMVIVSDWVRVSGIEKCAVATTKMGSGIHLILIPQHLKGPTSLRNNFRNWKQILWAITSPGSSSKNEISIYKSDSRCQGPVVKILWIWTWDFLARLRRWSYYRCVLCGGRIQLCLICHGTSTSLNFHCCAEQRGQPETITFSRPEKFEVNLGVT